MEWGFISIDVSGWELNFYLKTEGKDHRLVVWRRLGMGRDDRLDKRAIGRGRGGVCREPKSLTQNQAAGGIISASILSTPGASKVFKGGLTVYTLESRIAFGIPCPLLFLTRVPTSIPLATFSTDIR